jgi:hypothetical protein
MTREFKMLDYFIQGYFHQDWDEDGNSDEDIVNFFCKSEGFDIISSVIESFYLFIEFYSNKKNGIDGYFDKISCEYYYKSDGVTGYEWAERLKMLLEKGFASKKCA